MSEIPKKDIDRVFKDGSDRYNFSFNPQAWEKMEDLLDREKRRKALIWWWLGVLGIIMLVIALILIVIPGKVPPKEDLKREIAGIIPAPGNQAIGTNKDSLAPSENVNDEKLNKGETDKINSDSKQNLLATLPIENTVDQDESRIALSTHKKVEERSGKTISDLSEEHTLLNIQKTPALPNIDKRISSILSEQIKPTVILPGVMIKPLNIPTRDMVLDSFKIDSPAKNQVVNSSDRLLIGFSLSPEFNSVGYREFSKLSWKWGLKAEYQYAGKLGFSTGVQLINKKYLAEQGDYTPPKGFWTRKIAPVETVGECTVLEIPVGVSYYLNGHHKSGFFSEVGISSYLMLEEHYWYSYDVPDDDLIRYWGGNNENQHWMGILNASIGYNFVFSRKMTARFAPFTQIPFKGVGHGKVDLYSSGIQFSLLYDLR